MGEKRFRVRLVRPVFQYVDVEVEAGEERPVLRQSGYVHGRSVIVRLQNK